MIDRTNNERQKRFMARLRAKAKAADAAGVSNAEIASLKAELAALKADLAAARARLEAAHARRELPPDAERDRKIKSLTTRVRNLTAELRSLREDRNAKSVVMFDHERSAIIKALHPDRSPTERQRSDALQRFNAWWDRQPTKKRRQR